MLTGHCPWGGYTRVGQKGVFDPQTKLFIGPLSAAGEMVTDGQMESITDHYYG